MRLISGKANIVADCLSRTVPINNVVLSIDYEAMAKEQGQNAEVHTFHTAVTGLKVVSILCHNTGTDLLCDVSIGNPKPNVPFQHHIFKTIHNLAHSGQKSTIKPVLQKFVWHSLKKKLVNGQRNALHDSPPKFRNTFTLQLSKFQCLGRD